MKTYVVRITLTCGYDYNVRAKDYMEARKRLPKIIKRAEREFAAGNTEYDIDASFISGIK